LNPSAAQRVQVRLPQYDSQTLLSIFRYYRDVTGSDGAEAVRESLDQEGEEGNSGGHRRQIRK
jgi:hypothetical protein